MSGAEGAEAGGGLGDAIPGYKWQYKGLVCRVVGGILTVVGGVKAMSIPVNFFKTAPAFKFNECSKFNVRRKLLLVVEVTDRVKHPRTEWLFTHRRLQIYR